MAAGIQAEVDVVGSFRRSDVSLGSPVTATGKVCWLRPVRQQYVTVLCGLWHTTVHCAGKSYAPLLQVILILPAVY
ncbi:hypothetical protein EC2021H102_44790 [Escherichia coli]